ncbi:bifunctional indole-3-glycerol phosphate synthase/phosphoribosylanthranilate isomerase [Synergistales bacterium]|nr:bifunctional indole-3-glycerol phosphate synthase/phosphoribosylanthranilate isomerase [Synergistales bacterium]
MSVLDEIVARKRADVERREKGVSYADLRERAVPTTRRFGEALKRKRGKGDNGAPRFILECKKASPSKGLIRESFDVDDIAGVYGKFADAVSVLTDEPYFRGGLDILRSFRERVSQPILAKDFVIGPYQVREARCCGADAVLLMLSVLDDATYRACKAEAERLSMDVLTEAHSEAELERALALDARIIGINNRDLKTLKVDLAVFARLSDKIHSSASSGGERVVVCESGIESHEDVLRLGGRADAFLVGGSLMREKRLDLAVRRLIFGSVKVCGLTSPEDAEVCYHSGATFGGVIFAPSSPRRVDEACAKEICASSPLPVAGVFVNDEVQRISRLAYDLSLSAVQLHGEESESFIEELRKELPRNCEIWKALRVRDAIPNIENLSANHVLLDTFDSNAPDKRGGAGKSFDWSLIETTDARTRAEKVILAGGIDEANARLASRLGCFAIDVNSGVEIPLSPGKKDHEKVKRLFQNLR